MSGSVTDILSKLFNITVLDPHAPKAEEPAQVEALPAAPEPSPVAAPQPDNGIPATCDARYLVINCQYGDDKGWPSKLCVFKKGEAVRWYSLITVSEN
jgi:hypothetical protein